MKRIAFALLALSSIALGQAPKPVTGDAITGTITIKYRTRLRENVESNQPKAGVSDVYDIDLHAGAVGLKGSIEDKPRITKWGGFKEAQQGQLLYKVSLSQSGTYLGGWLGTVVTDKNGYYLFDGSGNQESKPRMQIEGAGNQRAFTDFFGGTILGKGSAPSQAMKVVYMIPGTNKTRTLASTNNDPVEFRNLKLGRGPLDSQAAVMLNGKLVFDRESGSWITEGIDFAFEGRSKPDRMTGGIKWTEEQEKAGSRKGEYSIRLYWNEPAISGTATEETFKPSAGAAVDEDSFIPVDTSKPGLLGTISFVDKMDDVPSLDENGKPTIKRLPIESTVTFAVKANNLERPAILASTKMLLAIARTFFGE